MLALTIGIAEAQKRKAVKPQPTAGPEQAVSGTRLRFTDGSSIEVDEAWESEQGVWYRQRGISHLAPRERVKKIERASITPSSIEPVATVFDTVTTQTDKQDGPVWIYLVGGARVEADSLTETTVGVWYRRGSLTMFLERSRVDRIEREDMENLAESESSTKRARGWTTGSSRIDSLIKQNGARHGVDPYLIFCVMEQESHFNSRALSPKGARGLMQLMPGTAARFGVRNSSDPAQNIAGGTRYLKELMRRFNGRIDLVLASYNAGEGAVAKFGNKVPPYRETRNYVKRISYRYRRAKPVDSPKATVPAPVTAGF
jgi:Zn-finger nucleic acid-binding protein